MNNSFFRASILTLLSITILLMSCQNESQYFIDSNNLNSSNSHYIAKGKAIKIADMVLGYDCDTRTVEHQPNIDYIISHNTTRNHDINDTLAYVINYPNDKGFVIVSCDNRVYPVLGYSNQGHFSFDNESAQTYFINNITNYLAEATDSNYYEVSTHDFEECNYVDPLIKTSISQDSPWNKFVIKEHPGCPAGCVAIASALILAHTKKNLVYHDSNYFMESIKNAIHSKQNPENEENSLYSTFSYPTSQPPYTYEQAVDSMAKIIYWIGKDVNMNYTVDGSGAASYDAFLLMKSLGYDVTSDYEDFDIEEITRCLDSFNLIYIVGTDYLAGKGHAWVSDGCHYCVDEEDESIIIDTYIHCDWGWGGVGNGYYSGNVFSVKSSMFIPEYYFAVRDETVSLTPTL